MTKQTLKAAVTLAAAFVLIEAVGGLYFWWWYSSMYDPAINPGLWVFRVSIRAILIFIVFPAALAVFIYRRTER